MRGQAEVNSSENKKRDHGGQEANPPAMTGAMSWRPREETVLSPVPSQKAAPAPPLSSVLTQCS